MKFSHKLSLVVLLLLGVLFTIGGSLLVYRIFRSAVNDAVGYNTNQHVLEKYALEADTLRIKAAGLPLDKDYYNRYGKRTSNYMGSLGGMMALYDSKQAEIYTNLPWWIGKEEILAALAQCDTGYILRRINDGVYMLVASGFGNGEERIYIVSAYDLTSVYRQRDDNLAFFWKLDAAVLGVAVICILLFSTLLTRPVDRLNEASRHIAEGNYSERVKVVGNDEIAQMAQSFNTMAAAVEEKIEAMELSMQQKDDFVSAFTHEIKTPMTTLIGYAQILRTKECEPNVRQRAASSIFFEAKRLEALSLSLLELMGLADTQPVLECVLVEDIFSRCRRSLAEKIAQGIELEMVGETSLYVYGEPELLVDLVRNLVLNALAAKPRNGKVTVRAFCQEGGCRIEVQDTGCGIPAKELERICEPFYMVDKARSRREGSSGLGLSIAQRIALLHGGSLHFESEVAKGTTVSFVLPLCNPPGEKG